MSREPSPAFPSAVQCERVVTQTDGRAKIAEPQVGLVKIERTLGQARFALEQWGSDAPGDGKVERELAGGAIDGVYEEGQQADQLRRALSRCR